MKGIAVRKIVKAELTLAKEIYIYMQSKIREGPAYWPPSLPSEAGSTNWV